MGFNSAFKGLMTDVIFCLFPSMHFYALHLLSQGHIKNRNLRKFYLRALDGRIREVAINRDVGRRTAVGLCRKLNVMMKDAGRQSA
jgi:hypothetical protein